MSAKEDLEKFYKEMKQLSSAESSASAASTASAASSSNGAKSGIIQEKERYSTEVQSKAHIDRLLRSGSTYFNLNPFEVLQIEPETQLDEIKKKYRKLSILIHPDKNQNDPERAQKAFDIITKAWKILECDETRKKCLEIVEEAKGRTDKILEEKRKKAKRDGRTRIPEENPEEYKRAIYVLTMKLFAEMERKRRVLDERSQEERKRKREDEIEEEERQNMEKEWQKNFEESRENRVSSWKQFKEKSSRKKIKVFKPPQNRPETKF